jgi:WXG100 family type VII secretion target
LPDSWKVLKMAEKIQVKYEELDRLISQIHDQADQSRVVFKNVQSQTVSLATSWQGEGAERFQREMEDLVLPALQRLSNSLEMAGGALGTVKRVYLEAEQEAVGCLGDEKHIHFSPDLKDKVEIKAPDQKQGWRTGGIGLKQKLIDGEYYDFDNVKKDIRIAGGDIGDYTYDAKVGTAEAGIGVEVNEDGDLSAGGYFNVSAGEVSSDVVLGSDNFGASAGVKAEGPSAGGFIGLKDGSVGGEIGGSLASVEASTGVNVAGYNVGATGGAMLGAKFGFKVGKKTEVKLGVFKLGLTFGKAKVIEPGKH